MSSFEMSTLDELLADDAIWGLCPESEQRLDRELGNRELERDLSWERSAAVLTLALQQRLVPPPSPDLMSRLRADAPLPKSIPKLVAMSRSNNTNILLVAALLMLAVFVWLDSDTGSGGGIGSDGGIGSNGNLVSAIELRDSLIREGSAVVWDWSGGGSNGDVVWDGLSQRGTMRFAGLPANDPTKSQYQLWIFDSKRDAAFPVDGGVFNVPEHSAETVISISPKIVVHEAQAFVVTVETPGGVVVSGREQVVRQAKPL